MREHSHMKLPNWVTALPHVAIRVIYATFHCQSQRPHDDLTATISRSVILPVPPNCPRLTTPREPEEVALLCGAARWHFPALPPCSHLLGLLRSTPSLTTTRVWDAIYAPVGCIVYINVNLDSKIKVKRLINTYSGSSTSLALPQAHLARISNTTAACPRFPAYAERQLR